MRIRKKPWAERELDGSKIFLPNPLEQRDISSLFLKQQPLIVELGCGKGLFLAEYAATHPDTNFIGIDMKSDILAVAHRNIVSSYLEKGAQLDNILLIPYDIARIDDLPFGNTRWDAVYIHFPNPWPKERHKKRRLSHPRQLAQYRRFLKSNGQLYFKTDDDALYSDTLFYLKECGFETTATTDDYYRECPEEKRYPATEHEMMFAADGKRIHYIESKKREAE